MNHFEDNLTRHKAFWVRAETDRPILSIKPPAPWSPLVIPVRPGIETGENGYLQPEMLDPERHFEMVRRGWGDGDPVDGDLFRIVTPYVLAPWLEAICGCPVHYFCDSGTMYPELPGGDWEHIRRMKTGRDNPWRAKLREFYAILRDLNAGRYPMGVTMPLRGPIDILGALVGVPEMCLAFAEQPQLIQDALARITDVWIDVVGEQVALVPPFAGGMANCEQYGLWAPGTNAVTQCDLAVVISPRTYERFLVPCDERICASLEYPVIHLHSVSMHVLGQVLSVAGFAAIQIVVDPGPADPPLLSLLPYFRRVQEAGKPLIVHCSTIQQAELDGLLAGLSPRGLCVAARVAVMKQG
jgi:hypothetical protein